MTVTKRTQIAGDRPEAVSGAPQVTRVPTGPFRYETSPGHSSVPSKHISALTGAGREALREYVAGLRELIDLVE